MLKWFKWRKTGKPVELRAALVVDGMPVLDISAQEIIAMLKCSDTNVYTVHLQHESGYSLQLHFTIT